MEFDENLQELFDRYTDSLMSESERDVFEKRLRSEKEFNEEYDAYLLLIKEIELEGFRKMDSNINHWENQLTNQEKQSKSFKWFKIGIAASFTLMMTFAAYWVFTTDSKNEQLYASFYKPYPNVISSRGNQHSLTEALKYYSEKKYENAIIDFKENLSRNPENEQQINFYIGQSYLANGDTEMAISVFEPILENDEFSLFEATQWYLALSYLKIDQEESATKILKLIALKDNHAYGTQAKQLLISIN